MVFHFRMTRDMENRINGKILLIISLIIIFYFSSLYLVDLYKVEHFLIGFFNELLTIPFLIAEIFFLFYGIKLLFSNSQNRMTIILSIVLLSICSILTIGSFIG